MSEEVEVLKAALADRDAEIAGLRARLEAQGQRKEENQGDTEARVSSTELNLVKEDIERYSRQMILPEIRVAGQKKLKTSSVLIVGCGGLGCPSAVYLAAAGVGRLGLVDHDNVDLSNLHRQVLHTEARRGQAKATSLATGLVALNSTIDVRAHNVVFSSLTALSLVRDYDVVLDCTDNVATRYLLSDACVLASRPLVSGSALRWEGQLTVYNWCGGPTYRCIYPTPPPPEAVTNCSDGGVVGAVPGVIGCLQALETIKIVCGLSPSYSGSLLIFDGLEGRMRCVKLRGRKKEVENIKELIDYEQFCGAAANDSGNGGQAASTRISTEERISVHRLAEVRNAQPEVPHVLVDVRPEVEVEMFALPRSLNVPLTRLQALTEEEMRKELSLEENNSPLYFICRRGNDSQAAVLAVREMFPQLEVKDVAGGLQAWARHIDHNFPIY